MTSNMDNATSPFAGVSLAGLEAVKMFIYYDDQGDAMAYELGTLDQIRHNSLVVTIHAGVRVAAAVIVGLLLAFAARSYRSMMFTIYELNMVLMLISSCLQLAYELGPSESITILTTGGDIPGADQRLGVVATVFQMLLVYSLLIGLIMQVYTAHSDLPKVRKWAVVAFSITACVPTWVIWMWRCVLVGLSTKDATIAVASWRYTKSLGGSGMYDRIAKGAWPSFAASTGTCSLILCLKLWFIHRGRAKLGLKHHDPVRVVLVMALQNSVIPTILAIISASIKGNYSVESLSATSILLTAIMMPMGYIWAQFEILKGSQQGNVTTPQRPDRIDTEKAKSLSKSQVEASTADSERSLQGSNYSFKSYR